MVDPEPVVGSEQGKKRPYVVVQHPGLCKKVRTRLAVPVTTSDGMIGAVGTVALPSGTGGLSKDSIALGFQIRAMDRTRFIKRVGLLSAEYHERVALAVLQALGLEVTGSHDGT